MMRLKQYHKREKKREALKRRNPTGLVFVLLKLTKIKQKEVFSVKN